MYLIIQKICEKNNKILKEGIKKVLNGEDISSLTGTIKEFTDVLGKELLAEIVAQIENLVFEDSKRKNQYESIRFAEKSLITKNGKVKFERRYYKDNETGENVCLTDRILGLEKGERIDKRVKSEIIQKASEQSYNKSGKLVVPEMEISATTVMRNVRKNEWKMEIKERKEEEKIKAKNIFIQVDEDHVKQRNKKGCTISKIVTIYTRKRTLTKPERIPEVKQVRKELVDKFTFSGLYKDTQEMWEDIAYYIDCTYKKDEIELKKRTLDQEKENLASLVETQQRTSKILQNTKIIRENYVSKLSEEEKQKQAQIDEMTAQYKAINTQILELLNQGIDTEYIGGELAWPVPGYTRITSEYGMRVHPITGQYKLHTGVDISAPMGANFIAANDGIVVKAEYNTAYGRMVIIDHGGGISTLYAHGSEILVEVGQTVKRGDSILKVGSSGYSTGPHAHFEVRINGVVTDPMPYITNGIVPGTEENDEETNEVNTNTTNQY